MGKASGLSGQARGWKNKFFIGAADTNATILKDKPGTVGGIHMHSVDATPVYLKFYNKATAPDENDTPVAVFACPGAAAGATCNPVLPPGGLDESVFTAGVSYRVVTGIANNSTGALTADEVVVNIQWR